LANGELESIVKETVVVYYRVDPDLGRS